MVYLHYPHSDVVVQFVNWKIEKIANNVICNRAMIHTQTQAMPVVSANHNVVCDIFVVRLLI